jgi:hypothetical protein
MENKHLNICDTQNYNVNFDITDTGNISSRINSLLTDFTKYISMQIKNVENNTYNLFIIQRGFETIIHCFKLLLLYTKNVELALYHSKKAYIYYVEFIGQIGYNNHSFLKLNSTDATLFVYKKTIFEINTDYKKNYLESEKENKYYCYLSENLDLYIIYYKILIKKLNITLDNRKKTIVLIADTCDKNISNVYNKNISINRNLSNMANVSYFVELIDKLFEFEFVFYTNIVAYFIKKIKKKNITKKQINDKLNSIEIKLFIDNLSHIKLVNFVFSN